MSLLDPVHSSKSSPNAAHVSDIKLALASKFHGYKNVTEGVFKQMFKDTFNEVSRRNICEITPEFKAKFFLRMKPKFDCLHRNYLAYYALQFFKEMTDEQARTLMIQGEAHPAYKLIQYAHGKVRPQLMRAISNMASELHLEWLNNKISVFEATFRITETPEEAERKIRELWEIRAFRLR